MRPLLIYVRICVCLWACVGLCGPVCMQTRALPPGSNSGLTYVVKLLCQQSSKPPLSVRSRWGELCTTARLVVPPSLWHAAITHIRGESAERDDAWGGRVVAACTLAACRSPHSASLWRRLVAACLSGARWCLTQALFAHDTACAEDPVVVVYHVSPAGVLTLLPIALLWEFPRLWFWAKLVSTEGVVAAFSFACAAGCIAYLMLLAEVKLLHETSSLSLSVGGALCAAPELFAGVALDVPFLDPVGTLGDASWWEQYGFKGTISEEKMRRFEPSRRAVK